MPQIGPEIDLVVLVFSREEVCAGGVGRAVDDLLHLSDDPRLCRQLAHGVAFSFDGWDDAPEVHEIPQCRAFIQALVREWPYFLHFLAPIPDLWSVLLLCLASPPTGAVVRDGQVCEAVDMAGVRQAVATMQRAMELLHRQIPLTPSEHAAVLERSMQAIGQVIR